MERNVHAMESATMTYDQTYGPRFYAVYGHLLSENSYSLLYSYYFTLFVVRSSVKVAVKCRSNSKYRILSNCYPRIKSISSHCLAFSCIKALDFFLLHVLSFKFLHPRSSVVSLRFLLSLPTVRMCMYINFREILCGINYRLYCI